MRARGKAYLPGHPAAFRVPQIKRPVGTARPRAASLLHATGQQMLILFLVMVAVPLLIVWVTVLLLARLDHLSGAPRPRSNRARP